MPQISQIAATYASQIFWLLITFGLMYFGIGKFMVPRVTSTVDARDARIAGDLAAAQAARTQADATEAAWRQDMDAARAAAQAETAKAKADAAAAMESQVRAADADLAMRIAHHDVAVANAKAEALSSIEGVAADAARDLVAKLSGATVSSDDATKAVRKAMAHV